MANITRYDPFHELTRFSPFQDFDDLLSGVLLRPALAPQRAEQAVKIEVSEDDKSYHVKAEVPGVKKDDIKVSIDGNRVSIATEIKNERDEKNGEKIVHSERYYGKQYRSFTLDQDVDQDKAEAKYNDGILDLTLPKKLRSGTKQLAIH